MAPPAVSGDVRHDGEDAGRPLITPALENVLTAVARRICSVAGPGTSAAIELAPRGQWLATVGSDSPAYTVTGLQYRCNDGPVLAPEAVGLRHVSDLGADATWPVFAAGARRLGVRGLLAVPLAEPDETVMGLLVVYSRAAEPLAPRTVPGYGCWRAGCRRP
ncbi:hypothetical protein [Streptomyces sp. NPDC059786]|uniref:hypothetical protein n=1 Tax=Streptomyces sp. NPDC059786 TaxID=3346946 RepID=UPI003656D2EC